MCEVTHNFKVGDLVMVRIEDANRYLGWPAKYRGPLPVIKISQFGKPVVKAPGFGGYFGLTVDPDWLIPFTDGNPNLHTIQVGGRK